MVLLKFHRDEVVFKVFNKLSFRPAGEILLLSSDLAPRFLGNCSLHCSTSCSRPAGRNDTGN